MKIGERVVCIKRGPWTNPDIHDFKEPVENEIYTIRDFCIEPEGLYISLKEYPCNTIYWAKWFRPLDYAFVERILSEIKKEPIKAL